jgi:limonene-1,2-epoxide hydrolase
MRIAVLLTVVLGVGVLFNSSETILSAETNERSTAVSKDIQVIEDFVAAFNRKDVDAIMGFFAENPIYHNMPMDPVQGEAQVRGLITGFIGPAEELDWEILNIAQSGDTVLAERSDRFVIDGKDIVLPCLGAFDMKDGKIVEWRDYFDMATWQKQNEK